jgi:hypothetical protein
MFALQGAIIYFPRVLFNPLTPKLNPFMQRCLTRYFTGDFGF